MVSATPSLVDIRSVEEVDARLDAAIYQLGGAGLIERLAESHRAETESRDLQLCVLQLDGRNIHKSSGFFLLVNISYQ
jgi:hypothetical protein